MTHSRDGRPNWDEHPCVEWRGTQHIAGYGQTNENKLAHRVVFEEHYGYLPQEPYVVDHMCRNRLCVQPLHLQVITRAENTRLGSTRREWPTHCPKGHDEWRLNKKGHRRCHRCHVLQERERRRRKRAEKANVR